MCTPTRTSPSAAKRLGGTLVDSGERFPVCMCELLPSGPRSSENEDAVSLKVRPHEVPDHSVLVCVLCHSQALSGWVG